VTSGLKCAPDTGPIAPISTMRMAPVRRVAEQRERGIAARQPLAHDAGADDGREQEPGAQPFSSQPSRKTLRLHGLYAGSLEIALLVRPILSSSF
jgi:hypothetical protein